MLSQGMGQSEFTGSHIVNYFITLWTVDENKRETSTTSSDKTVETLIE